MIKSKVMKIITLAVSLALVVLAVIIFDPIGRNWDYFEETVEVWNHQPYIISYRDNTSKVYINKPASDSVDALILFHGTTESDEVSHTAAQKFSELGATIADGRDDLLTISVAYRETNVLIGDELPEAEAVLHWVQEQAATELGVAINKVYILGHSRGGYIAMRLNDLYEVDGVIANGPGPVDFYERCLAEERALKNGVVPADDKTACQSMMQQFNKPSISPKEYQERSLLTHVSHQQSPLLIMLGENETGFSVDRMPELLKAIDDCGDVCAPYTYKEISNTGHWTFDNPETITTIQNLLIK